MGDELWHALRVSFHVPFDFAGCPAGTTGALPYVGLLGATDKVRQAVALESAFVPGIAV